MSTTFEVLLFICCCYQVVIDTHTLSPLKFSPQTSITPFSVLSLFHLDSQMKQNFEYRETETVIDKAPTFSTQ